MRRKDEWPFGDHLVFIAFFFYKMMETRENNMKTISMCIIKSSFFFF